MHRWPGTHEVTPSQTLLMDCAATSNLNSIASYCDLLDIPVHRQLAVYTCGFKGASKQVLSYIQHNEGGLIQARRLAFSAMSMALWFNNAPFKTVLADGTSTVAGDPSSIQQALRDY